MKKWTKMIHDNEYLIAKHRIMIFNFEASSATKLYTCVIEDQIR